MRKAATADVDALAALAAGPASPVKVAPVRPAWDERRTLRHWTRTLVDRRAREGRRDESEESRARVHIEDDELGAMYLEDVGPAEVRAWLSRRLEGVAASRGRFEGVRLRKPLARTTVQNALNLLRVVLEEACVVGRIASNPAHGVQLPRYRSRYADRSETKEARALTAAEVARLLDAPLDPALRARVVLTLDIGWRLGEMQGIRCEDIDLAAGRVTIRKQWDGLRPTKSGRAREVLLTPDGADALRAVVFVALANVPDERLMGAMPFAGGDWSERLGAASQAAGLRRVTWHDLRHTSAVGWVNGWWGQPKMTTREVGRRLGHASVMTTERYLRERGS